MPPANIVRCIKMYGTGQVYIIVCYKNISIKMAQLFHTYSWRLPLVGKQIHPKAYSIVHRENIRHGERLSLALLTWHRSSAPPRACAATTAALLRLSTGGLYLEAVITIIATCFWRRERLTLRSRELCHQVPEDFDDARARSNPLGLSATSMHLPYYSLSDIDSPQSTI